MKSLAALGLLCVMGAGFAADGAQPAVPVATPAPSAPAPKKPTPAPGPVLTPGPVVTPADPWAEAMAAFASADSADAHAGGVVFVGSSSIRLWADLEKRYSSYAAVNRGFGGSTLADCVKHMDRLVLPHKPRLVVIYAGDNDLAGGRSADQVLLDFVELTARIQERLPKTQIVFVSIKPSPARIDLLGRIRETNTRIRDYVATKPYLRYIDVFTPMLDAQGKPRGELFGGDSLHLNEEGYALWHALISPVLPTDEQPAMVKGAEPKAPPLAAKDAATKKADAPAAVRTAGGPAPAAAPKPEAQKAPPAAVADAKRAPPAEAAAGKKPVAQAAPSDSNAAASSAAPANPGEAAPVEVADLPRAPASPQTVRADVKPADAAPPLPSTPPFPQPDASAPGGSAAADAPASGPAEPAVIRNDVAPAEAATSEIAKLPPPPRTVRANVQPANAAPASAAPASTPSSETRPADAASEPAGVPDGVIPESGPTVP